MEWHRKAADQGHVNASFDIGFSHYMGLGVPQVYSQAKYWYHRAAEQGHANPRIHDQFVLWDDIRQAFDDALHVRHQSRDIPPKSFSQELTTEETKSTTHTIATATAANAAATSWTVHGYEQAVIDNHSHIDDPATTHHSRASRTFSDNFKQLESDISEPQHSGNKGQPQAPQQHTAPATKDLPHIMVSVTSGDKDAQVALGNIYRDGVGVQQVHQAAMDWYLKAADQGDSEGLSKVGYLYDKGLGVPQDYSVAMEWYRKAADQGDVHAQYSVGYLYYFGRGGTRDQSQSMYWCRKAADQGHPEAQYSIGNLYDNGGGVVQDRSQAMDWWRKAADHGHNCAKWLYEFFEAQRGS
ncbi:hypothetical protein BGX29_012099 [Mortierella sp. GBA35]|nr:hypothetical protein BGX29_012099 [Mortierella sp. GBA35]